jgi:hypothetical protein
MQYLSLNSVSRVVPFDPENPGKIYGITLKKLWHNFGTNGFSMGQPPTFETLAPQSYGHYCCKILELRAT